MLVIEDKNKHVCVTFGILVLIQIVAEQVINYYFFNKYNG